MAENQANAGLERAQVIVYPPDGKIPYRPEAVARQKENFANRATADPETKCFQPGVPRAACVRSPFQIFQNDRAVHMAYQDVHAYRITYLNGTPHNEGLGYAMGDSRGHWEGNTLVADVTSFSDATWLDAAGNYHSDQLHVVERYTCASPDALLYEATIENRRYSRSRGRSSCRFACRREFTSWRMNAKRGRTAGGITCLSSIRPGSPPADLTSAQPDSRKRSEVPFPRSGR